MAHRVRGMNKAPFPPGLVGRPNQWWFEVEAPFGQPFASDTLSGTGPITLPPGTHVHVRSGIARVETVVVMNARNEAIYDTLTGVARPSVTAGAYRQGPRGIEVAVVFLKRWFGDVPSLRSLCDEEGFIVCAEPPGGLIDDVVGCDFLHQRPSNTVIRRAARREIWEEFGRIPILSLRICRYPLASLAIAKASTFQAFVELHPTAKPRVPRPRQPARHGRAVLLRRQGPRTTRDDLRDRSGRRGEAPQPAEPAPGRRPRHHPRARLHLPGLPPLEERRHARAPHGRRAPPRRDGRPGHLHPRREHPAAGQLDRRARRPRHLIEPLAEALRSIPTQVLRNPPLLFSQERRGGFCIEGSNRLGKLLPDGQSVGFGPKDPIQ
jgi:hypothetical protein